MTLVERRMSRSAKACFCSLLARGKSKLLHSCSIVMNNAVMINLYANE